MADQSPTPSSTGGIDPKLAALLSYLTIVAGIIFYVISKDKYVRFHAMQSILLGVVAIVFWGIVWWVPFLWFFTWIIELGFTALVIVMMVKAYQGEKYKLPVIGNIAEKNSQ